MERQFVRCSGNDIVARSELANTSGIGCCHAVIEKILFAGACRQFVAELAVGDITDHVVAVSVVYIIFQTRQIGVATVLSHR